MTRLPEHPHHGAVRSAVWLARFLALLLLASISRFVWVQVHPAAAVARRVRTQTGRPDWRHGTTLLEQGRRGRILARDGTPLAIGYFVHDLVIDPVDYRKLTRDRAFEVKEFLGEILRELDPDHGIEDLEDALYREFVTTRDGRRVTIRQRTLLRGLEPRHLGRVQDALRRGRIPGATLVPRCARKYPFGSLVSQVVGLAGEVAADPKGGVRGRMGVERSFDGFLAGKSGAFLAERDARGQEMFRSLEWTEVPHHGADVRLSLDLDVQQIVTRALDEATDKSGARQASAVVLDVTNGDVLGCASWPTVDRDDANADFRHLSLAAVQARYSPGSTMKPLILGWARDHGAIRWDERFDCGGVVGSRRIGGHLVREYSVNPEPLTPERILIRSSNVGAVTIGFERLGLDGMYDAFERVGLTRRPLRGFPGVLPGYHTSRRNAKPRFTGPMFPQGYEMALSPLALARLYLAFARGGRGLEPRLILSVDDGTVRSVPVTQGPQVLSPDTTQLVTQALVRVLDDRRGTGRAARSEHYTIAGKSGTGQVTTPEEIKSGIYNAWFCAFAPAWEPRVVVVVHQQVKNRGPGTYTGGAVSGPVAKRIIEETLGHFGVPHDRDPVEGGSR